MVENGAAGKEEVNNRCDWIDGKMQEESQEKKCK